ncbi:MAG: galactose oxidase-like domain-containing protein, partial [Gemmatimonadales bacterium]
MFILYACQDNPELTGPSTATAAVAHKLTIIGSGTGTGTVTSVPSGINCRISLGAASGPVCSKLISGTVTLKAAPALGHAFAGWTSGVTSCVGTGTCQVNMTVDRNVTAKFNKGPFTIKLTSTSGTGTGKVKIQVGTTLLKTCSITNGVPNTTSCTASVAARASVTLTPVPATNYAFNGWKIAGCGTDKCQFVAVENLTTPATFALNGGGNPRIVGKWDLPVPTPVVVVHAHQLSTGKVLLWGDKGGAYLWGAPRSFELLTAKPFRLYCSGHGFLPDGRLLIVGGTDSRTGGLRDATLFNPMTKSWGGFGSMALGRYYPTITTLPNGSLLAVSGQDANLETVSLPEISTPTGWRQLTGAPLDVGAPFYPPQFVAPDGKVFLAGFVQPSRWLDVNGTGQWSDGPARVVADRVMGSAVMYEPGKVLYVGGGKGVDVQYAGTPTATAEIIDLNNPSPIWKLTATMKHPRRQLNATILADGTVLVTGGTSGPGFNDQAGAVHVAELWDPQTGQWSPMASEQKNRTYHSTALLLASGRVLSSGSGEGGGVSYANAEFSLQLFSPPYLFNPDGSPATRPTISSAPAAIHYTQAFTVETPNSSDIVRGNLIRTSSVTHAFNQSQLLYPLEFEATGPTTVTVTNPPKDGAYAP